MAAVGVGVAVAVSVCVAVGVATAVGVGVPVAVGAPIKPIGTCTTMVAGSDAPPDPRAYTQ